MKQLLAIAATATLLMTSCKQEEATLELEARLSNTEAEVADLKDELEALHQNLDGLRLEPKTDLITIYKLALTVKDNDSFIREALRGLASTNGGMEVIQNFILANLTNRSGVYACELMAEEFADHPAQEKYLREIKAADLSKCPGGEKLTNARNCVGIAANALYRKKPEEFAASYLESALKEIVSSSYDPSNMDEIYENILLSFSVSDRAKKRDYVEALIRMYAKAWTSSESKAGYQVLQKLTGQKFGSDDDDSKEVEKTYDAYMKWFEANKSQFPQAG